MTVEYLHGIETIRQESATRPIQTIKTSVVALVGTAPIFDCDAANQSINTLKLITNDRDAAKYFGTKREGYTIPQALDAIFDHGSATLIVCNVFDPAVHKASQAEGAVSFSGDALNLGKEGVFNVVIKNSGGTTTYVAGTDYTIDAANGIVTRLSTGAIASGASVLRSFDYADVTAVDAADIIGETDTDGIRSGLQAILDTYSLFGYKPKILLCPSFCTLNTVASAMQVIANNKGVKGMAIIDAPVGTSVEGAISGRGAAGTINFNYSDNRMILCYPHLKVYNTTTEETELEPFSQRLAGLMVKTDREKGFWYSPSNQNILGIAGIERAITCGISDYDSEANQLNAKGIVTVFNDYGTGFLSWGNHTSAYPAEAGITQFIPCQRVADAIEESIEYYQRPYMDRPITTGLIDAILQSGTNYLNTLKKRGAIIDGKCWYDPQHNSADELAAGNLRIDYSFCPPPPLNKLTFASYVDTTFLNQLGGNE